jgi:hypothetical protein
MSKEPYPTLQPMYLITYVPLLLNQYSHLLLGVPSPLPLFHSAVIFTFVISAQYLHYALSVLFLLSKHLQIPLLRVPINIKK